MLEKIKKQIKPFMQKEGIKKWIEIIKTKVAPLIKYKGYVNVKISQKKGYLKKQAVNCNSIIDKTDDNYVIDTNGHERVIYKTTYLTANGMDSRIDEDNKYNLLNVINLMTSDIKVYYLGTQKNLLDGSIKQLKIQMQNADEELKEVIQNRIHIMEIFNRQKYINCYFSVNRDNYDFEKNARQVLYLEKLEGQELQDFIYSLNNGFVLDARKEQNETR